MLSVYVIVRQWAGGKRLPDLHDVHTQLIDLGEKFVDDHVLTTFLAPIRSAIARRN